MGKIKFEMMPIPAETLKSIGLVHGTTAECFIEDGRIIIQKADDDGDGFCDNFDEDCEGCPFCCPECGECLKEQIDEFFRKDDEND